MSNALKFDKKKKKKEKPFRFPCGFKTKTRSSAVPFRCTYGGCWESVRSVFDHAHAARRRRMPHVSDRNTRNASGCVRIEPTVFARSDGKCRHSLPRPFTPPRPSERTTTTAAPPPPLGTLAERDYNDFLKSGRPCAGGRGRV